MPNLERGYEIIDEFLNLDQLHSIKTEIATVNFSAKAGGIRNAEKNYSSVKAIATSKPFLFQAKKYLTDTPLLVRAILFNKTAANNWLVTLISGVRLVGSDKTFI